MWARTHMLHWGQWLQPMTLALLVESPISVNACALETTLPA